MRRAAWSIILGVALGLPAGVVQAQAWTVPHAGSADGPVARSLNAFAEDAGKRTAGALTLRPRAGVAPAEVERALAGPAAVAVLPLERFMRDDALLRVDRVPFLAVNMTDARSLWQTLQPTLDRVLSREGLVLLYAVTELPRGLLGGVLPRTVADLRGRRIAGTGPGIADFAAATGAAAPVAAVSVQERLQALSSGRADLAFVSASEAMEAQAWEHARYYLHAPAWVPKQLVVVRRDALVALPRTARDALLSAADAARVRAWDRVDAELAQRMQNLRDRGLRVRRPDVEMLIALEELGRSLLLAWSEGAGEEGAALVEAYYTARLRRP